MTTPLFCGCSGVEAEPEIETTAVKISARMARAGFTECGPDCIAQNGCKGNCCKAPSKPGGCFVTVHPDERKKIEALGGVVANGMIQPRPGIKGCPFQSAEGLCRLHGTPAKPFGCIASPFTLNRSGTLIIRHRYFVLPCHAGPGAKRPAYQTFRASLNLIFGEREAERICGRLDVGSGDFFANMPTENYDKMIHNDQVKRLNKRAGREARL